MSQQAYLLQMPMVQECIEVGDVFPPAHRNIVRDRRSTPTPLVVIAQPPPLCERVVLREQVVVMRTGPAMEHDDVGPDADRARENLDIPDGDRLF